jgi:hypothetical protein
MSVEIETIGLDIDGTKIILDKDAAKELYFKLKELFDSKNPTYIPYPIYPQPAYPYIPLYPTYFRSPWCTATTNLANISVSSGTTLTVTT